MIRIRVCGADLRVLDGDLTAAEGFPVRFSPVVVHVRLLAAPFVCWEVLWHKRCWKYFYDRIKAGALERHVCFCSCTLTRVNVKMYKCSVFC